MSRIVDVRQQSSFARFSATRLLALHTCSGEHTSLLLPLAHRICTVDMTRRAYTMDGLSLLLALLTLIALASRFLFSMRNLTVSQIRHYLYTPLVHIPANPTAF